jgi:uncharacterized protein YeeX (DUF496 family)
MAVELESRVSKVESTVADHERRIADNEDDIECIQKDCITEKVSLAELKVLITQSISQNDKTMQLLKWVVLVAVAVIGGLTGIKFAIPGI